MNSNNFSKPKSTHLPDEMKVNSNRCISHSLEEHILQLSNLQSTYPLSSGRNFFVADLINNIRGELKKSGLLRLNHKFNEDLADSSKFDIAALIKGDNLV